ncbi:MAG: hypothetical protein R3E52_05500 [Burkholderiaceae bacterium]
MTSFDAYADYQQRRGSSTAWTWEHQAMTGARMVPIVAMRERMHAAHRRPILARCRAHPPETTIFIAVCACCSSAAGHFS